VSRELIDAINRKLASFNLAKTANRLQFKLDSVGHYYYAEMNHDYQKYHEEDAIVTILDVMENLGWTFKFQYDSSSHSDKVGSSSMTDRELFIFTKSQ
jgi:hypothetical protein